MEGRRRSDAEANRDRILEAARQAFADPTADVSMAEIARLAGLGSATLYRNFATRRELLEALYLHEIDAVCAAAVGATGATPGERLAGWLRRFAGYYLQKGVVAAGLLEHTDEEDPVFSTGYRRLIEAGTPLLRAAQRAGEARRELGLDQVLALIASVARIPGGDAFRTPLLDAAIDTVVSAHRNGPHRPRRRPGPKAGSP